MTVSFTTERLTIRPWRTDEAERLLEIRSIPEVAKWLSTPHPWSDLSQAIDAIVVWSDRVAADGVLGHWAVVPHGQVPVGSVSLQMTPDDVEMTIGWYLDPESGGNGYASEAARALLRYGLDSRVDRIWAIMWPENDASVRVAQAIGMTDLGDLIDPWYGEPDTPYSRMFCAYPEGSTAWSNPSVTS